MRNPITQLSIFVLDRIDNEPLAKRAALYQALATITGDETEAIRLNALAADCLAIEKKHLQLALDFKRAAL